MGCKNSIIKMKNSPISKPIEVVAAIIQKDDKFLITKRLKKSHLGHCWEFPGGKMEPNETVGECIIRECREEIDVEIKPIRKIKELTHSYPEITVHLHFMLCELISGVPKAIECADLKWATASQLSEYEFPEADMEIIHTLLKSPHKKYQ